VVFEGGEVDDGLAGPVIADQRAILATFDQKDHEERTVPSPRWTFATVAQSGKIDGLRNNPVVGTDANLATRWHGDELIAG
jgi:hypothetical protein